MLIDQIFETAHDDRNIDLVTYFEERPYDMSHQLAADYWRNFLDQLSDNGKRLQNRNYYELPAKIKRRFADWTLDMPQNAYDYFMHDDPHGAPAWMLLEPVTGRLLPKNTPLVHLSDHAEDIKEQGFTQGVPDVSDIALTREHSPFDQPGSPGKRISHDAPGYNFAYMADGSIDLDLRAGGYGASAILFRSTGMLVHHHGDQENQVVFWGPAASTRKGVVVTRRDSRWVTDGGNSDLSLNRLVRRLLAPRKGR